MLCSAASSLNPDLRSSVDAGLLTKAHGLSRRREEERRGQYVQTVECAGYRRTAKKEPHAGINPTDG
ncbi:hypothetical protein AB1N83_013593 [Pleurotus pulmonarius]